MVVKPWIICLIAIWLKPFVRGFLKTKILILSIGVHHLLAILWSGTLGFSYQIWHFFDQAHLVLVHLRDSVIGGVRA
ncbi:hypothetical protein RHGRI_027246 [Rhododendron griersonianum]|uniref:Uncharacterized protein n=1 Tax=Rhododendron griersonianum TaxID=479676 RepID=A0AAV6J2E2_9ERIC|nr:hypothetical protein RHGRI_027246 [Rhododendron griersonianum]